MNHGTHPPPLPRRGWAQLLPYLPLAALVSEAPWYLVSALFLLFLVGDAPTTVSPAQERALGIFLALPADLGLLLGIAGTVFGWAHRPVEWVCLLLGFLGCAVVVGLEGWNLMN